MKHQSLIPGNESDLVQTVAYALDLDRSGHRLHDHEDEETTATAERVVQAMKRSGYLIIQRH